MALWIVCGYLGFAALFYLALAMTAARATDLGPAPRPKWQRAKRMTQAVLRRVRSGLASRPPK